MEDSNAITENSSETSAPVQTASQSRALAKGNKYNTRDRWGKLFPMEIVTGY